MFKSQSMESQSDYNNLIDMKQEQLESTIKDYEINIDNLKGEIVKCYELAQPHLLQMRVLKQQLKKIEERMEAAKTFLSLEKNGSLISSVELLNETQRLSITDLINHEKPLPKVETRSEARSEARSDDNKQSKPKTEPKRFNSPLVSNWMKNKPNSSLRRTLK